MRIIWGWTLSDTFVDNIFIHSEYFPIFVWLVLFANKVHIIKGNCLKSRTCGPSHHFNNCAIFNKYIDLICGIASWLNIEQCNEKPLQVNNNVQTVTFNDNNGTIIVWSLCLVLFVSAFLQVTILKWYSKVNGQFLIDSLVIYVCVDFALYIRCAENWQFSTFLKNAFDGAPQSIRWCMFKL